MSHDIERVTDTELTAAQMRSIAELCSRCFASSRTVDERFDEMQRMDPHDPEVSTGRRYMIHNDGRLVAHARTFVREIVIDEQTLPVLALAAVCSDPDYRGLGLGAAVTRAAFERVGIDQWPKVSLFQTPVPEFYEKLNSRKVENKFVNRQNEADPEGWPWLDATIMIYPVQHPWPDGLVDLNGPGY